MTKEGIKLGQVRRFFSLTSQAIGIEVFRFEREDLKLNGVTIKWSVSQGHA